MMRYKFIKEHSRHYPISILFRVMDVTSSVYYRWRKKDGKYTDSKVQRNIQATAVADVFKNKNGKIGSRGIVKRLNKNGMKIGRYRVRTLMRNLGLVCRIRRSYKPKYSSVANSSSIYHCINRRLFSF